MKNKFLYVLFLSVLLLFVVSVTQARAFEKWDVREELTRLSGEAPNFAAYNAGVAAIWWKWTDRYSLAEDGGKLHESIYIISLNGDTRGENVKPIKFPYPDEEGAVFSVTLAAWYDPENGDYMGELTRAEYDLGGIKGIEIDFPGESAGYIAIISTFESIPGDYRLDDVLPLAAPYPVWERTVEAEVPGGLPVYWEGTGVMEPERNGDGRIERYVWAVLNEPAITQGQSGLVSSGKPSLVFSLDHGQFANLKKLREMENVPFVPKAPAQVLSVKSDLKKTIENIARYMSSKLISEEDGTDRVRRAEFISPDGPWTGWEQVLIAARWLSAMGFETDVYWNQKITTGIDGPMSLSIWKEPVLRAKDKNGGEFFFKSGQTGDPQKLHSSLYGETLYRAGNNGVERIVLQRGTASDHMLSQNWKISVDEKGMANGTLDVTLTGAWIDIFTASGKNKAEDIASCVLRGMNFTIPGMELSVKSTKNLPNGVRATFSVLAAPGIVSQDSLLLKLLGGIPACFTEIPKDGTKFSFRFPFIFDINSEITTPKGYRVLSLPSKAERGDSKSMVEQSLVHWPKKRQAQGSCRWTVRSFTSDEYQSARIAEQLAMVSSWPLTAIPLKK